MIWKQMEFKVIGLDDSYRGRWIEFIEQHPDATVYHHPDWQQLLRSTFNYKPVNLVLEDQTASRIKGLMLFMQIESMLTGNRLVSLPFTTYCDPLMSPDQVVAASEFIQNQFGSGHDLQYKNIQKWQNRPAGLNSVNVFFTHLLDLRYGQEELWQQLHNTSIRQRIKKSKRLNLCFEISDFEDGLKAFYKLHIQVRRKWGLPPLPFKFFKNILDWLGPSNRVLLPVIKLEQKVLAAAIVLKYKDRWHLEYSASEQRKLKYSANQRLIWEIIKIARASGAKVFDFGRTAQDHHTLIEFKERWGARPRRLHYYQTQPYKSGHNNSEVLKLLKKVNRCMPGKVLELEGRIIFPHTG